MKWPNRNKYGAKKALGSSGRMYDSMAERDRAEELRLLEQAGEIVGLAEQPRLVLAGAMPFKPDFVYVERGRKIYEDVKGFEGERFRTVCQLWPLHGPGVLRVVKRPGRGRRFIVTREILPKGVMG